MIHAENSDVIDFINEKLHEKKPLAAEEEASYRVIALAKMIDVPILIVHMSSKEALGHVRRAQTNLVPIYAETYEHDHFEGAKYICSPPLRQIQEELEGVWESIINGTVSVFSSDHAPAKYDHPKGKKAGLINSLPHYKNVPNGLPGVETRVSLLLCYGVETGRISPHKFVELTATNAAKLYGLSDKKGTIGIGMDADITIWYPKTKMDAFKLTNSMLHHDIDYTPYEGMEFTNWPRYTILRGSIAYDRDNGEVIGDKSGRYFKRGSSSLAGSMRQIDPIFE